VLNAQIVDTSAPPRTQQPLRRYCRRASRSPPIRAVNIARRSRAPRSPPVLRAEFAADPRGRHPRRSRGQHRPPVLRARFAADPRVQFVLMGA
jgi:hypothetical protein